MTPKQIIEMIKLLSKHFVIDVCGDMDDYRIATRLYPTDRYINANHKTFEGACEIFCTQVLKHTSGKLHKEIEDILR